MRVGCISEAGDAWPGKRGEGYGSRSKSTSGERGEERAGLRRLV